MKLTTLAAFLISFSAIASDELLFCSLPAGDTESAQVVQDGTSLRLVEATNGGEQIWRPLSQAEWASQKIRLHGDDEFVKSYLVFDRGGWTLDYKDGSIHTRQRANCR